MAMMMALAVLLDTVPIPRARTAVLLSSTTCVIASLPSSTTPSGRLPLLLLLLLSPLFTARRHAVKETRSQHAGPATFSLLTTTTAPGRRYGPHVMGLIRGQRYDGNLPSGGLVAVCDGS
jgi:hypothetical protein